MSTAQHFDYYGTDITYLDFSEELSSVPCQPRDIHILDPLELDIPDVKEDIAVDIRLGQGSSEMGIRKNLLHEF